MNKNKIYHVKIKPKRNNKKQLIFKNYPNFKPNLTPREIFMLKSFGGTYFRPIYSSVTKKKYKNIHKKYNFLKGIPNNYLTRPWKDYDKKFNNYGEKVGTTLQFWQKKHWITKYNPYGWVHWYCDFYNGRRCPDDKRQIMRWKKTAGSRSRFKLRLISLIMKKKTKYNDFSISPKIRQTLQHWGVKLTLADYNEGKKYIQKRIKENSNLKYEKMY